MSEGISHSGVNVLAKILKAALVIVVFTVSFLLLGTRKSTTLFQAEDETHGVLCLRIATTNLPPEVSVLNVRLQHATYEPIVDSIVVENVDVDAAGLRLRLPAAEWLLTLRALDHARKSRYVGLTSVAIDAGCRKVATVLLAPEGSRTERPEILLRWGERKGRWTMLPGNPVLTADQNGWDRDHYYIASPSVIKVKDRYFMWYMSASHPYFAAKDTIWTVLATSANGIEWKKISKTYFSRPLLGQMVNGCVAPTVIQENGVFRIWFEARRKGDIPSGIGYATSADGICWNIASKMAIDTSESKRWVSGPSIVRKGGSYYLYYAALGPKTDWVSSAIWLATSPDGNRWADIGRVLSGRKTIAWESCGITRPFVMVDSGKFVMYYSTISSPSRGLGSRIGRAESRDGTNWSFCGEVEEIVEDDTAPWYTESVSSPTVLRDNGRLRMWFAGLSRLDRRWQIGYAESDTRPR